MHDASDPRINHFTIHLLIDNDHGSLPRILLQFARRQLKIQALHFFDLEPPRRAELQIDLDCPADAGQAIADELRRLECVSQALLENVASNPVQAPNQSARPTAALSPTRALA